MIILIAAVAENNALGKNNDLLWHLPKDFKRFKEITSGHHIIMGRKTFESFPKPLPNRTHVIITRQKDYVHEGCIVVQDLESAIAVCPKNEDAFVIGGGEIYSQSIHLADQLDITRVHHSFEADVYFPEINSKIWELTSEIFNHKDEKHLYDYTFQTFVRKT
ncbi:diacylglycerol kinase [Flavobacterium alvei]|uniref:Dihydrofolate reductase n=1 Tax=Flavobacterium alvei TaxID=2080416 RepID=A0A2S5ACX4_9FLAO|nr:dihydrofolate reductase [Flavobacterium alvei]POY40414.1 diacylglycerol kinase [Flavobacterium alvei]HQE33173.1 dihydrofolate reductase [Flavobacterium alvei]HQK38933.1 dihydrofolate reductase [Flavobacterium alvei]